MEIVFMGTPKFAVPSLLGLIESKHNILAVVTQPDRPRGRGKRILQSPVKEVALQHGIRVLQPERIGEPLYVNQIESLKPDTIVVIAYGQILPKNILTIPPKGCINVHASLLPKYRGAAPINWAIINGEKETGVTTMYMDEGLDTGDMIYKSRISIDDHMDAGELHDALSEQGRVLLLKTLESIEKDQAPRIPQNNSECSHAPMLDKEIGEINWERSAIEIHNLIRGINPWPGAYTFLGNSRMKIWESRIIGGVHDNNKPVGSIVDYKPQMGWIIKTGKGLLAVTTIQMPNGRKMHVDSYICGHHVAIGTVLGGSFGK